MIYILLSIIFYTAALLFGVAASRNTNTALAAAVTTLVSMVIPIIVVIPIVSKKLIVDTKAGLAYAAASGVTVAIFALCINKAYVMNKVGVVAPAVWGGAIFLSTIISYFAFKEKISWLQGLGLLLVGLGFIVILYARATGK